MRIGSDSWEKAKRKERNWELKATSCTAYKEINIKRNGKTETILTVKTAL